MPSYLECTSCRRLYVYGSKRGHTKTKCNSCCANKSGSRAEFKQKVLQYLGGKCAECGYNRCPNALHAHHRNPAEKEFSLTEARCRKWSEVKHELDKCTLLCANCHAEAHYKTPRLGRPVKAETTTVLWPAKDVLAVWVETWPLEMIGKKLGVSGTAVKKRCKKLGIVTRGRGGWSGRIRP